MTRMPLEFEEQAVHEDAVPTAMPFPETREHGEGPVKSRSSAGVVLGAIALILALAIGVFGLWLFRSVRRQDRRIAAVSQQVERLSRRVGGAELQSMSLAQKASQAAANAKAAAEQRDEAKQAEETSAAQAKSALQAAAAAQDQAKQAEQQAEAYRKQHEQDLQQLQKVLGGIAETHRTAVGLAMTLGEKSIRFDAGKWEITPQSRDILNRIAGVLLTAKQYSIYVYGYTDDPGTSDYNLKLSAHRTEAVRNVLVQAGISPSAITTKGFGKSDPRAKGNTAAAHSANRRVEIGIVDSKILTEPVDQK
ncbi:MAG TPA: OmpA family protein [Candidatus Binatia bacterium]|nr:OmpA family protein [Candidatus Binatia bacterium]